MGYDLYAIKPEHYDEFGYDVMKVFHKLCDDEWYKSEQYDYCHRIWREWRNGFYCNNDGQSIYVPDDINNFFYYIHDSQNAYTVAAQLNDFAGNDINVKSFTEWLIFWADKGAMFHLSM